MLENGTEKIISLDNKNYLTEQDIITNYNNMIKSTEGFDFYYNGLTKGISKVFKAFVYLDGNYEELKATKIVNTMNKEINLVYRQTSPNWKNKVIKTYDYIGQNIKETIKVNDGKKESSISRIYAPNNLLLEEENSYNVKTKYVYDNYDILTKKKISKGSELYEEVYEYDSNNEFMVSSKDITGNITNIQMNPDTLGIIDSVLKGQVKVNTVYYNYNRIIRVFNNSNESIGNNITYDSSNRIKTISDSDDYHYEIEYDIFGNVSSYSLVDKNKKTLLKEKDCLDINGWDYDACSSYDYQTGYSEKVLLDKYGRPFRTVILKENVENGVTTLKEEARVLCNYQGGNMLINDSEFSPKFNESQSIAKIKSLNDGFEKTEYEYKYDNDNNLAGYTQTKGEQVNLIVQQISDNETKYEFKSGERYKTSVEYNNDTIEPRIIATSNYDYDSSGFEAYTQMLELCNVYEYDDILGRLTCIKPARETDEFTIEANLGYKDDGVLRNKPTSMDSYFSTFNSYVSYKGYINNSVNYNEHNNIKDIIKKYYLRCKYNEKEYYVIRPQEESIEYMYDGLNRLVSETHNNEPYNENGTIGGALSDGKSSYEKCYYYTNDSNKDINKITQITDSRNEKITKFEYDKFNRLTKYGKLTRDVEKEPGVIDYDKYTFNVIKEYTYGNYLNPINIKVSYNSYDLKWGRSNLLTQYGSASYKYNYKGIRFEKTDLNKVTTTYYYDGDKILGEDRSDGIKLRYFYDLTGIIGFTYKGIPYRYIKDVDGNIEWLVRFTRVIARYDYDNFGNCTVINLSNGGEAEKELGFTRELDDAGEINPIRWRSQYLDTDTGYYYMNQRYYDPQIGQYIDSQEIENIIDGAFIVGGLNMYGVTIDNHINIERNHNNILTKDELAVDPAYDGNKDKSWWQLHWKKVLFVSIIVTGLLVFPLAIGMFKAAIWSAISSVVIGGFLAGAKALGYGESFWGAFFDGFMDRFIDGFNTGAILYCIGRVFVRGGNCFIEGTLVHTESGHKPIENIEVGDKVWAYDEETGEQQLKEVVHLFRNTTDTWYHIEINNEKITCTKEHPYWIPNLKTWVNAGDLEVGMNVLLSNGNYGKINSVEIEHLETPETTYNFEVRDFHTYYVGIENILVHNTCATEVVDDMANSIDDIRLSDLPDDVRFSYEQYSQNGWKGNFKGQTPGTKAGGVYNNIPSKLPTGSNLTYREFDAINKVAGMSRGAQRFVVGNNMSVYYTPNHYASFFRIVP